MNAKSGVPIGDYENADDHEEMITVIIAMMMIAVIACHAFITTISYVLCPTTIFNCCARNCNLPC